MAKISIKNLKSIKQLDFEIPTSGVHILTGINGSGKTTLLACLERLYRGNAFQINFKTSTAAQFDNFSRASIGYSHNGQEVVYSYSYDSKRWLPNPFRKAGLLKNMGFSDTLFLSSTGERFYVQDQNLNHRYIVAAHAPIKAAMNDIFQTTKFDELRRVKLDGRGRGEGRVNYGYLMPSPSMGGINQYYSEKNFSLGEILLLNALIQLQNVRNNSLVLVDEIELALHPKVQVKFLKYLEQIAAAKNLSVIISSHSSSLIKAAPSLIYLEKDATGIVRVEYDCFPAVALQNVAVVDEVQPDVVFFVEDNYAKYLLEAMLNYYFRNLYAGRKPIIKILPVGGWAETIKFTNNSSGYLLPTITKVIAVLDADVEPNLAAIAGKAARSESEQGILDIYNAIRPRIRFLPITPELGMVEFLNNNPNAHIAPMQTFFGDVFDIEQILQNEVAARGGRAYPANVREAAKQKMKAYVDSLITATRRDKANILSSMFQYYVADYATANRGALVALFNPIFN